MSDIVEACRTLLDGYEGEHKQVLQRIWDHYEDEGTLEDNLLKGFDDDRVGCSREQFIEMLGQLEGDLLKAFYSELDTSEDFADSIVKEMSLLPDLGKELTWGEDETEDEPASSSIMGVSEETRDIPQPQPPKFSRDELREAMADPRYKNNPSFRAEVTQGFESLYGDESAAESNPSSGHTLHSVREESTAQEQVIE